jgi:perosamine synthetase
MDFNHITDFIRSIYPRRDFIPLHEPFFGGNEKQYLSDCIDSTYVSSVGRYVEQFENMVRDFTGTGHAIATMNGTAALHVALKLCGVRRGDLVITQPLTFIATCNAISYCGAKPLFIDVDGQTLGLSAAKLESWLLQNTVVTEGENGPGCYYRIEGNQDISTPDNTNHKYRKPDCLPEPFSADKDGLIRLAACVPMHTFGHPCEIDRIVEICARYHIPVVEDSAESIGSYYQNRHTGTFGKLGIFSFNGNKTITTGGGGMIVTEDADLARLAKHITTTAKKAHKWNFEHDQIGYNYRLPNINAALGCAQMEALDKMIENKRETASFYQDFFSRYENPVFVPEPNNSRSNYWLNAVLFDNRKERDDFLEFSNAQKVMTRPAWILMNKLPMFTDCIHGDISNALELENRLVNIPSSYRPG